MNKKADKPSKFMNGLIVVMLVVLGFCVDKSGIVALKPLVPAQSVLQFSKTVQVVNGETNLYISIDQGTNWFAIFNFNKMQ